MTTIQIELTRLDAQLSEVATLLHDEVDVAMAEADAALRALAEGIAARRRAAMAAVRADAERRLLATVPPQATA
ncbi:MAG: hypothetical protein ACT4P1_04535 [Sporichthyaceae bacterium]